jgi:hypothetical protein
MHLLEVILSFPTAIYSLLLTVCLLYWLTVLVGALSVDVLGGAEHAVGGADGAIDGHVDGAIDGHASALDGGHEGAFDGHAEGAAHAGADGGAEGHDVDGEDGFFTSIFSALKLRSAPVTVVLSIFSLLGWLSSGLALVALEGAGGFLARLGVFAASIVASLLVTSVVIRPLAPIFDRKDTSLKSADLYGKVVIVSTGSVTETFGQADLVETGHSLTLQVRADSKLGLKKGMRCVIVDHDDTKDTFSIEALPDLDARPRTDSTKARVATPEIEDVSPTSTTSETSENATRRA